MFKSKIVLTAGLCMALAACGSVEDNVPSLNTSEGAKVHATVFMDVFDYSEGKYPSGTYEQQTGIQKVTKWFGKPSASEKEIAADFYSGVMSEIGLLAADQKICVEEQKPRNELVRKVAKKLNTDQHTERTTRMEIQKAIMELSPCK